MNASKFRVLVTGLGLVSCGGRSVDAFWDYFIGDALHIEEWPLPPEILYNRRYYAVADVEPASTIEHGRAFSFAADAARAALLNSGWGTDTPGVLGVSTGTGMGTYDHIEAQGPAPVAQTAARASFFDLSGRLTQALRCAGPSLNVSTACAAGAYSLAMAFEAIRSGEADAMLAGGAEGFGVVSQGCFNRLGALDDRSCRPFSSDRRGTLFGEGAAYLVLESENSFRLRGGTRALAELRAYGMSCDGFHVTAPPPSGEHIAMAARQALTHAAWTSPVSAVVPHGTGTHLNDKIESRVMAEVLGSGDAQPWMVPIKGRIGHGGGSAGAFSSVLACLMLQRQAIPPCGIDSEPDPACRARFNRGPVLATAVDSVVVNAYAFGGNNISLLFTSLPEGAA